MSEENNGGSCPTQYHFPSWAIEIQDLIEHRNMNGAMSNIFKACYRNKSDNTDPDKVIHEGFTISRYDLNKIGFFQQRELARLDRYEATLKDKN